MKPLSFLIRLSVSITALLFVLFAKAQTPNAIKIERVDAMGSGCPIGSVSTSLSPDNKELSLLFDKFVTEAGGNINTDIDKKMCVVNMDLSVPAGWSIGLISADYRGFAAVEAGAQGQHEVLYSFNRSYAGSSFSSQTLRGPFNDNYLFRNVLAPNLVNWTPCHTRSVTLTVRIGIISQVLQNLGGRRPSAMMTLDTMDTSVRQSFQVGWRTCGGQPGNGGNPNYPPGRNDPPGRPTDPGRPPSFPPGQPVDPGLVDIFQMWDGKTRYYTMDARLVERGAWVNQGVAFKIYRQPNRIANLMLFQCIINGTQKYFLSSDRNCEGHRIESQVGYISSSPQQGMTALQRLVSPNDRTDFVATTNPSEVSGFIGDRNLGFVTTTRPRLQSIAGIRN